MARFINIFRLFKKKQFIRKS